MLHRNPRSEPDPGPGQWRIDDLSGPQACLDRLDAALEEGLLLAGRVVLGVLLEVAVLLGGADPGDHLWPLDSSQLVELGSQPRRALDRQVLDALVGRRRRLRR